MAKKYLIRRTKYRLGFYNKKRGFAPLKILLVFLIFLCFTIYSLNKITSLALSLAEVNHENEFKSYANKIIAELLSEKDLNSLIHKSSKSNGVTTSVTIDYSAINQFKTELTKRLNHYIISSTNSIAYVPLGSLFSDDIFMAQGPKIPIKILASGSALVNIYDNFITGGVNQTMHKLILKISADLNLHTLYKSVNKSIEIDVPLTEIITVGEVPTFINE